jgi:hypothetical protein
MFKRAGMPAPVINKATSAEQISANEEASNKAAVCAKPTVIEKIVYRDAPAGSSKLSKKIAPVVVQDLSLKKPSLKGVSSK